MLKEIRLARPQTSSLQASWAPPQAPKAASTVSKLAPQVSMETVPGELAV